MRSDSPPARWYEPADPIEDDEHGPDPAPAELLTITAGCVWWTATVDDGSDD